jgi:hypothetical protein
VAGLLDQTGLCLDWWNKDLSTVIGSTLVAIKGSQS